MKKRMCYFLIATLQIMTCISYDASLQQGKIPHFPQQAAYDSKQGVESVEETYRWLSRVGSRPPSCQHKCDGCIPCDPIQAPTTNDHIGVQYANYEPEGWKCKCGASFFNP